MAVGALNRCVALTVLFGVAVPSYGRDPPQLTFTSLGNFKCTEWIAERKKEKAVAFDLDNSLKLFRMRGWLNGYLTGVAEMSTAKETNVLDRIDSQTIIDWMDIYCAKHSGASALDGAAALIVALRKLPTK